MAEYPSAERLMAGELGQWLHSQVAVREDAKKEAINRLWKGAIIAGPVWLFVGILGVLEPTTLLYFGFGAAAMIWYWSQAPKRAAVKQVKTGINEAIAGALGLAYVHDLEPGRGFALAKAAHMVPGYDRASFEDMWSGHYAGHPFVLHEAHLEERQGSGKNTRWVTVFRGSILTMGFRRKFHGTTLVARKGRHGKLFGGSRDYISVEGVRLDFADMVHPEFVDTFDVYTNDQVEARYIVHPRYIERLIAVEQAFAGEKITSIFSEGELVVALNCGNLFESGSIDAGDDHIRVARTIDQFARLADLADALQEPER